MAFTYLKVKSAKCLRLLPVVLVLVVRIWSCLHHWLGSATNIVSYFEMHISDGYWICRKMSKKPAILLFGMRGR